MIQDMREVEKMDKCPMCGLGKKHQKTVPGEPKSQCEGCLTKYFDKERADGLRNSD